TLSSRLGLATVIPKVSQVDNSSDFLGKVPHRKHPGICNLKTVKLPPELVKAACSLVAESSVRNLENKSKAFINYLWSRKRPLEAADLCRKAQELEQKLRGTRMAAPQEGEPGLGGYCGGEDVPHEQHMVLDVLGVLQRVYTNELSFVYMVARMDGVFAAVCRAFHEIQKRVPEFQPSTLLDFGSGTGAVSWAAHSMWGKTLKEYMNIDSSAPMLALAEKLMKGLSEDQNLHFPGVYFRQFLPVSPKVKFDLVVSAFSLNELTSYSHRVETVQALWRKTDGFLVLVENGTKEGHQMLMEARDVVLKGMDKVVHDPREARVFAPCPHHLPCPRLSRDHPVPCNFVQMYRPLPFSWNPPQKEEKFFYLIVRRGTGESEEAWPRITQSVLCRPRHVHLHLCCADGHLQHCVITSRRHGRDLYRCARTSSWGDRFPVSNPESQLPLEAEAACEGEDRDENENQH
uniref:Ribosome assembly protein METTL17, mitochondrial n=1 Tax=Varanus komodoensis TaxID=61221 RepID=A0A8D2L4G8_VARKO